MAPLLLISPPAAAPVRVPTPVPMGSPANRKSTTLFAGLGSTRSRQAKERRSAAVPATSNQRPWLKTARSGHTEGAAGASGGRQDPDLGLKTEVRRCSTGTTRPVGASAVRLITSIACTAQAQICEGKIGRAHV